MKTFSWLIKREFWEHRGSFFWAPVITACVMLALNLMGIITGEVFLRGHPSVMVDGTHLDMIGHYLTAEQLRQVGAGLDMSMLSVTGVLSTIMAIVVFFYCLGALYDDRRDRSILFWKSLPISDRDTVLSKVISATVLVPVITIVVGILAGLSMLVMVAITATFHGANLWTMLWTAPHPFQMIAHLLAMIPLIFLWALPTIGWLLLCSAAARSKPFLWALAVPVGAGIIVSWFSLMGVFNLSSTWFWQHIVARMLLSVFPGGWMAYDPSIFQHTESPMALYDSLSLGHMYASLVQPEFWVGAIAGIAMITLAIFMRGHRDDS
ncbi:hypothetical protein [Oleiagrimonas sp. C23AA]|uniref:hypothetical protein n=1 Tax=Oleiagrimonas sp. C23AA TaxID=2719047 RepID=UPI0014208808|nr:hypothetical protein [Oleiagrimonas sp. C23AA]NII10524.1 hypothetical protein [Oleiagrimonas sp. C23AA]